MVRTFSALVLGVAVCAAGAQGDKKSEIKGGVEATVKSVDAEKGTLTVTTAEGRQRTFSVTDDTTIVGPRGGVVRRRLNDPRFHPGLSITVVASGTTATELHLGYNRKEAGEEAIPPKAAAVPKAKAKLAAEEDEPKAKIPPPVAAKAKAAAKTTPAKEDEEEDEQEFPGKVKSADPARRMLVITLLNGKDRSFLLAKDVPITVKGKASREGLEDSAVKAGIPVTVITEPGGRKVKEVHVAPAPAAKGKKAG
jgi:hypothetical protein